MFDIDRVKDVNDKHGRLCGGGVLPSDGNTTREVLRGSDLKMPLRRGRIDRRAARDGARSGQTGSPSEIDTNALIVRADAAPYQAKDQGRNCVRATASAVV